jgi:hypothetical protein
MIAALWQKMRSSTNAPIISHVERLWYGTSMCSVST